MKIIVLRGEPNCGKTATIGAVYNLLIQNDFSQFGDNYRVLGADELDFKDIMIKGCKKIGITSLGDELDPGDPDTIEDMLIQFERELCFMAIIACTDSNQEGLDAISKRKNVQFVEKTPAGDLSINRVENALIALSVYKMV